MDFFSAKKLAVKGALILRPTWLNPLRWNAGKLEFVRAVFVAKKRKSRSYRVTKIESRATDWVVA